jgi:AraC family transcriptional regulator
MDHPRIERQRDPSTPFQKHQRPARFEEFRVLQTSANPEFVPEERYIIGKAHYGGASPGHAMRVWRTRVTAPNPDLALTYGGHSGHIARLYLHNTQASEVHQARRALIVPARASMETSFRDVHELCAWPVAHRLDQIVFDLPTPAVARWAENHAVAQSLLRDLQSGLSVVDPTLRAFGLAVIPALKQRETFPQFFIDSILDGVCAYLFKSFAVSQRFSKGGLAPWQERRAKELMEARIAADFSLEDLARECGLSAAHFTRAFRRSCGTTPYKWLITRRIERAKKLLQTTDTPLTWIAAECGFSDQAHFTNVFSKALGRPPGAFRRYWSSN